MTYIKSVLRLVAAIGTTLFIGHSTFANALGTKPDVYVVMFSASWCSPCKIVEPKIKQALNTLGDPNIEYVNIDISNPALSEAGAHKAFNREIVAQYNGWLGVTGFAAIIDADTKRTLGCVNMLYDTQSMTTHIRNLKTYAMANKPTTDITCPDTNR
ncbi:MAG: thioredoxin family protein [Maricaulaceae bacterium]